jgi:uncharacterized protein
MSDTKDQHEPSMEEILASIRRIISEDEQGAEGADAAPSRMPEAAPSPASPTAAAAAPPPAQAPAAQSERPKRPLIADVEEDSDGDVLLLTEEAQDDAPPPATDAPLALEVDEPPPEPDREPHHLTLDGAEEPAATAEPEPGLLDDRLISQRAAAASLAAMSELVTRRHREPKIESLPMGQANQTLEDITRELLRPILKSWLDDNLPQIVERIVREEIGRLALDAQRR